MRVNKRLLQSWYNKEEAGKCGHDVGSYHEGE